MVTDADEEDVDSGWGSEDEAEGSALATPPKAEPSAAAPKTAATSAGAPKGAGVSPADVSSAGASPAGGTSSPLAASKTAAAEKPTTASTLASAADKPTADKPSADKPSADKPFSALKPPTGLKPPGALASKPAAAAAAAKVDAPKADAPKLGLSSGGASKPAPRMVPPSKAEPSSPEPSKAEPPKAESIAGPPDSKPQSVPPGKPPSKAPPPKLAVGPRPDAKLVPPAPRAPSIAEPASSGTEHGDHGGARRSASARVPPATDSSRATMPLIDIDLDVALGGDDDPARVEGVLAPRTGLGASGTPEELRSAVKNADAPPASAPPKSRSFTPRVTNAVQQAKELDVRVANDPNVPTPPGTSVVQAALEAAARRESSRPPERPTPLRMPSVSMSREPVEAPRPATDSRPPATTSLRFSEQPKVRPIPRDRKQTLKLNVATQNFAVELLSRDVDPASTPVPGATRPFPMGPKSDTKAKASSPMLDLHLPDDLGPAPSSAGVDDGPEVVVSDEGETTDSFDDLPIDEVLEAVRQSSMPPAPLGTVQPVRVTATAKPRISDRPLEELGPISDLPPTVRGEPTDAMRFGPTSEPPATVAVADDGKLDPIRERFDRGDFTGALLRAEALLEESPGHAGAKAFVQACQEKVKEMYIAKLGSCSSVLHVVMARDRIQDLAFDHRGGFLISLIDGVATVDDVLDISGMPQLEALRLLYELKQEGVIDTGPG